jgi:hypothetical protein
MEIGRVIEMVRAKTEVNLPIISFRLPTSATDLILPPRVLTDQSLLFQVAHIENKR